MMGVGWVRTIPGAVVCNSICPAFFRSLFVLWIEPRTLTILAKCSTTELHSCLSVSFPDWLV